MPFLHSSYGTRRDNGINHQGRTGGKAAARGCNVLLCIVLRINQVTLTHLHRSHIYTCSHSSSNQAIRKRNLQPRISELTSAHAAQGARAPSKQTPPLEPEGKVLLQQSRFPEVMEEGEEVGEEVKRPMRPALSTINPPALNLGEW